jgi:hypothetical protein
MRNTAIQRAVRPVLSALKAAWLQWSGHQLAAADAIFQRRIDPLTGLEEFTRRPCDSVTVCVRAEDANPAVRPGRPEIRVHWSA